ncbi:L-2-amino-thiazoline-4-carboxylic acid hydrolase [Bifidobacterium pullorum subsp. saeculare]|uniref:L-2-amino-thiazoline-4-carboxylic acid hydrolase n=1 Tax=Bifidobacterium pullorum subsp. saeculare TaxID=78257 RepID=A0A938WYP8_9BIFI|nr:L-2-amino-thiazoline-4-carboxylic acid hydrolase [Bifidobacterium pullorum]MBM6699719.1 L-2-amino-thiazoline-4-carboxylic acid hydrolase [Bifidobacterium pullorum subsp. saeculare]
MAYEHNVPHLHDATIDAAREISERRAATISRMVDEAAKHGLDDQFAYDAVADYGTDNATAFRRTMKDPDSFAEFADSFGTDHNRGVYEMETVTRTDDELRIDFHYCPYVTAWVRQGKTPEQISRLCAIAMAGDHAFADEFPYMRFDLEGTIADGNPTCVLRFTRQQPAEQQGGNAGSEDSEGGGRA